MPEAAHRALAGSLPFHDLERAALISDEVARYVDFALGSRPDLMAVLTKQGPEDFIAQVRQAEEPTRTVRASPERGAMTTLRISWQLPEYRYLM